MTECTYIRLFDWVFEGKLNTPYHGHQLIDFFYALWKSRTKQPDQAKWTEASCGFIGVAFSLKAKIRRIRETLKLTQRPSKTFTKQGS